MVHFPNQMLKYGPARHHWCMLYEGKHGFFKKKKYSKFKNLPLSMAKDHQLYICYKQSDPSGERAPNFLYEGDSIAQGEVVALKEVYLDVHAQMCDLTLTDVNEVYIAPSGVIHGLHYKQGCALVLGYEDFTPFLGVLRDIIVHNHKKFVIVELTDSIYNPHIASYMIHLTGQLTFVPFLSLKHKWPLSVYNYEGENAVMNCHSHCCEIY